jgi:hypothetical protein
MIMEPAWAGPVVELVSGYAARRIRCPAPAADQGEHRERVGQHQPDRRLARAQMGFL